MRQARVRVILQQKGSACSGVKQNGYSKYPSSLLIPEMRKRCLYHAHDKIMTDRRIWHSYGNHGKIIHFIRMLFKYPHQMEYPYLKKVMGHEFFKIMNMSVYYLLRPIHTCHNPQITKGHGN